MDKIVLEKLKTLTILYAEDEEGIRRKITDSLKYYVKDVIEAKDGEEALKLYSEKKPDIIFTDIMMPHKNGVEFVKAVREKDKLTPIVIITAHTEKEYLLSVVDMHLEHYLVKPINLKNLKETLKKCLDVISKNRSIASELFDGYSYDFDNKILSYQGKEIKLSKKEIDFFELLFLNRHRVVTYSEIENYVWKDEVMSEDALKSLVRNLRHKLPKEHIVNLSGVGYRLKDD